MAEKYQMKAGAKNEYPYTPARLVESEVEPYVIYYVWDAQQKKKVRKRVSLVGATAEAKRKDAVGVIKEINRRLKEGWHIDNTKPEPQPEPVVLLPPAKKMTIEEAITFYTSIKSVEFRDNTEGLNDVYFKQFRSFLTAKQKENIALADIKQKLMFEFFDTAKVGGRFRNNMLGFFQTFFKFFQIRELLESNPCMAINKVRVDASEDHRPFNAQQAKDIREAILATGDEQLWLFCQFIYFLFLRPGEELRLLKVGDILSDQVRVSSTTSKNRKVGFVDIPAALERMIQYHKLRDYAPTAYVFTRNGHPGHEPVGVNYFYKRHRKIMEQLGLFGQDYDLYSWKPTGAVVLYRATNDIMLVQRHCRHSTPDQTYTYLRKHGLVFEGRRVTDFPELWE